MVKRLTDKQEKFAEVYARTGVAAHAALKAGYVSVDAGGSKAIRNPAIMKRVDQIRAAKDHLSDKLGSVVEAHTKRILAKGTTNREFSQLVTPLYKAVGLFDGEQDGDKELHEMTRDELARQLRQVEHELGDRAIDVTPSSNVFD